MLTWVLRFSAVSLLTRQQAIFGSGNHLQLHLNTKAPPFRRGQESDSDIDIVFGTGELKGPLHIDTYRVGPMAVEKQPFAMIREMTGAEEVENVFKLQSYINFCGEEEHIDQVPRYSFRLFFNDFFNWNWQHWRVRPSNRTGDVFSSFPFEGILGLAFPSLSFGGIEPFFEPLAIVFGDFRRSTLGGPSVWGYVMSLILYDSPHQAALD